MGSLMAGWSTSPTAPDQVLKRSNSSVTKDELDRFWRRKKNLAQEHLDEANKDAALSPRMRTAKALAEEIDAEQKLTEGTVTLSLPEGTSRAWWTKSKWAFLNDPPTVNLKESNYVPQFDVATLGQLQAEHPAF